MGPKDNQESLKYDINLKSFERAKESWQMDGEEKLEQSLLFKEKGTEFFKQSKYDMASKKYNKILNSLSMRSHSKMKKKLLAHPYYKLEDSIWQCAKLKLMIGWRQETSVTKSLRKILKMLKDTSDEEKPLLHSMNMTWL